MFCTDEDALSKCTCREKAAIIQPVHFLISVLHVLLFRWASKQKPFAERMVERWTALSEMTSDLFQIKRVHTYWSAQYAVTILPHASMRFLQKYTDSLGKHTELLDGILKILVWTYCLVAAFTVRWLRGNTAMFTETTRTKNKPATPSYTLHGGALYCVSHGNGALQRNSPGVVVKHHVSTTLGSFLR